MARSFTYEASGIELDLRSDCFVSSVRGNESDGPGPEAHRFTGLWDTGATGTVIARTVVERCNLSVIGRTTLWTATGREDRVPIYAVDIRLPNDVVLRDVAVALGDFGADVLIGMDIITQGDFAVSNFEGRTAFSFRIPSAGRIDFVRDDERSQA